MNITALQTFLAIVDTGNLVRASQKLNVTQSTVTARLKSLEDELGQQLLNRQKSGTTLTPAGTKLLRYARIMTGLWRQARYETGLPAVSVRSAHSAVIANCGTGRGGRFSTVLSRAIPIWLSRYNRAAGASWRNGWRRGLWM